MIHQAAVYGVDVGSGRAVVIDIGGGSVEITLGTATSIQLARSFKIGVIRLTERFVRTDPLSERDGRKLSKCVLNEIDRYCDQITAIGFDRLLATDFAVSVNGVFVRGYNLPGTIDYNPVLPARLGPSRRPNDQPCSVNPQAVCVGGGIPGTSASVLQYTSFGESWYKGLTVALNKRLSRNYQFLLSYTLSSAEDTSTDFQSNFIVQNSGFGRDPADRSGLPLGFDPETERGPATHDQRHRLVWSGVYVFPREIQLSGIMTEIGRAHV